MELHLTGEELEELRSALDSMISDLSPEIADTDNPNYRTRLRHRRDLLSGIRARLAEAAVVD